MRLGSDNSKKRSLGYLLVACELLCCAAMSLTAHQANAATVDRYWEVSPYRIQLLVRFEASATWNTKLLTALPNHLKQRAKIAYGPLWNLSIEYAAPELVNLPDNFLLSVPDEQLATTRRTYDKLIILVVEDGPLGFHIATQEYDCLLEQWGAIQSRTTHDPTALCELAFDTVKTAFTPLATFRVVRDSPDNVELKFRGGNLPRVDGNANLASQGQVLRPLLRRVDRDGQPVDNGIQQVPWTYFSVDAVNGNKFTATIVSHTARPLGVRQRGRVNQVAAIVRPSNQPTRLRLHARDQPEQPLAGFRVYQRDVGSEDNIYIGKTDDSGAIAIAQGKAPIQVAFVQSSGQWIAKIPLVPGADRVIDAPLSDDRKRQEAEAKLIGIREELIDLVARRNILAARARAKIKAKDIDGANQLVHLLEGMRTATEFEQQRIRQQERLIESSNPRIQQRIEKLFNDTRDVLAEFLPPGLVQQLKREIAAASTSSTP